MHNGKRLRAVVFDFDGTLARPSLDFSLMKRRIAELAGVFGVLTRPGDTPALEWIESLAAMMPPDKAGLFVKRSHDMIENMEDEAASRTTLFGFARPVLERLLELGVAPAVITRNTRRSVKTVFPDAPHYLALVLTREDVDSVKPDPEHLLAALGALGASPQETLMVGDHPLDVLTAKRAGTLAAAVASGGTPEEELKRADPDFLAADAGALLLEMEREGWF